MVPNVWGSGDSTIAVNCATVAFISDDGDFTVSSGCTAIGGNFCFYYSLKRQFMVNCSFCSK